MRNLLFIAACLMALASCKNSGSTDTADTTAVDSTATAPAAEATVPQATCYLLAEGPDSTFASLTIAADGTVTGSFDWVPNEKDGAHGTLTGKNEGGQLKVMYDYMIEGSQQKEEMLMKVAGDQLLVAKGELTEGEGGAMKLKDPSKVTWTTFGKVACKS